MLENDDPLVETLGASGAHVIRVENLQHSASCVTHEDRGDGIAEHERWHDHRREVCLQVLERTDVAGRREPAQRHREKQDEHDPEPEVRRRQPPEREYVRGVVPEGVLEYCGNDAGGEPNRERDDNRQQRELERDRQFFEDEIEHRLLDAHRFAQIALEHAAGPVQVADRKRIVQMQLLVQVRDDARIPVFARENDRRVSGQQLLQAENQDRDEEQSRKDGRQTLNEIVAHKSCSSPFNSSSNPARAPTRRESCAVLKAWRCAPTASDGETNKRWAGP